MFFVPGPVIPPETKRPFGSLRVVTLKGATNPPPENGGIPKSVEIQRLLRSDEFSLDWSDVSFVSFVSSVFDEKFTYL